MRALKVRTEALGRAGPRPGPRRSAPPTARPKNWSARSAEGVRPVLAPRRLRGRPRQRRLHRLLGRRDRRLIDNKSQHAHLRRVQLQVAKAAKLAPKLAELTVISSEPDAPPSRRPRRAWTSPPDRRRDLHRRRRRKRVNGADEGSLVLVDATSGAGGLPVDITETDVDASPQKSFASDGGLWIGVFPPPPSSAPNASTRAAVTCRSSSAPTAIDSAESSTPGLATLFLLNEQLEWINGQGGLGLVHGPYEDSTRPHTWAEESRYATPSVADPAQRSQVIGTIDFADEIDAAAVAKVLRANGIVDTEPYRKLGQQSASHVPGDRPGGRRGADERRRRHRSRSLTDARRPARAIAPAPSFFTPLHHLRNNLFRPNRRQNRGDGERPLDAGVMPPPPSLPPADTDPPPSEGDLGSDPPPGPPAPGLHWTVLALAAVHQPGPVGVYV